MPGTSITEQENPASTAQREDEGKAEVVSGVVLVREHHYKLHPELSDLVIPGYQPKRIISVDPNE